MSIVRSQACCLHWWWLTQLIKIKGKVAWRVPATWRRDPPPFWVTLYCHTVFQAINRNAPVYKWTFKQWGCDKITGAFGNSIQQDILFAFKFSKAVLSHLVLHRHSKWVGLQDSHILRIGISYSTMNWKTSSSTYSQLYWENKVKNLSWASVAVKHRVVTSDYRLLFTGLPRSETLVR